MLKRIIIYCGLLSDFFMLHARPFFTSDADLIAGSQFELEMGSRSWSDASSIGLELKHGVTQKMNLAVCFDYTITLDSVRQFSPLELNLKYGIISELFAVSVCNELGSSTYSLKGIINKDIGNLSFLANAGLKISGPERLTGSQFYSLLGKYKINKFKFGLEAKGDRDGFNQWLTGLKYIILDNVALDAAISGEFKDHSIKYLTAGLGYEF